jgi:metalloendopeptidase, putative, glycoprotease family
MRVLSLDTSCDDTSLAILEWQSPTKFSLLFNFVSSQAKIHAPFGGVWPYLAKLEHKKNLPIIFKKAQKSGLTKKIDLIAVTVGPGLEPCLWEGINFAQKLAKEFSLEIVPVNHLEAHIFANFFSKKFQREFQIKNVLPAISLIVSGGHTLLIFMENFGKYQVLGETRDDAAGECLDKIARFLGLGYPGGPIIERIAKKGKRKYQISLPRPMIKQKNYDFSFSGLKTAVVYLTRKFDQKILLSKDFIFEMAREAQDAVFDVLIEKTKRAIKFFKPKSLLLSGGVAANKTLQNRFEKMIKEFPKVNFFVPPKEFCTDNAAMVGLCGSFLLF